MREPLPPRTNTGPVSTAADAVQARRQQSGFEVETPFDFRAPGALLVPEFRLNLWRTDKNFSTTIRRIRYRLFNTDADELWRIGLRINGAEIPNDFRLARYIPDEIPGIRSSLIGNGYMPRNAMRDGDEQQVLVQGNSQLMAIFSLTVPLFGISGDQAPAGYFYLAGAQILEGAQ